MTDLSTTPRSRLSQRDRLAAWESTGGHCCICGLKIDGTRERWIVEHIRPLALAGADDSGNRQPAHERCAAEKTRGDLASIAKAKRVKARHINARPPSKRPLPGSRASGIRKRMSGAVERWPG